MSRQHLTLIACSNCRKKRTKCDGKSPCERCKSREEDCAYESRMWRTKGQLRAEVENLYTQQQHTQAILQALVSRHHCRQVLRKLRHGDSVASIAKTLPSSTSDEVSYRSRSPSVTSAVSPKASEASETLDECTMVESPADIGDSVGSPEAKRRRTETDVWWKQSPQLMENPEDDTEGSLTSLTTPLNASTAYSPNSLSATTPASDMDSSLRISTTSRCSTMPSIGGWTDVTKDVGLINDLVKLYFSWEHPMFSFICREPFLRDFHDGRRRYCSSALVNAMLSLACRFLDPSSERPDGLQLSDCFFYKAKQHLADDNETTLPGIQALGLLSLREMVWGLEDESMQLAEECAKMALSMNIDKNEGSTVNDAEYCTVRATTICGAFSLCRLLSMMNDFPSPSMTRHDGLIADQHDSSGASHRDLSIAQRLKPEFSKEIVSCEPISKSIFELTELIYTCLSEVRHSRQPMTGNDLLGVYTKYLKWYESAFECLRKGGVCSPSVLFLHIYYQYGLILLFGPFGQMSDIGPEFAPRAVCVEAVKAISSLTQIYSRLFTLRKTPCFLPRFVFSATMARVLPCVPMQEQSGSNHVGKASPSLAAEMSVGDINSALTIGITQLADMSECHPSATHGLRELTSLRAASVV